MGDIKGQTDNNSDRIFISTCTWNKITKSVCKIILFVALTVPMCLTQLSDCLVSWIASTFNLGGILSPRSRYLYVS